jgi:hypothetical protein
MDMKTDRIDFISAYCDRWCERCAYTSRCSLYACEVAAAMCGDYAEGIELAVGAPHPVDGETASPMAAYLEEYQNVEISAEETAEYERQEAARDARIQKTTLTSVASAYTELSLRWLTERHDAVAPSADPVLAEALEIVSRDSGFIAVKLHRALDGRDRALNDDDEDDDDPVQNDWNGSAKVALISIDRSETAWRAIAQATGDQIPLTLAEALIDLRQLVMGDFPNVLSFIRPGFDEPWR